MAETAAYETNIAQTELTPAQRFAGPLYAAGLSVLNSVEHAKQSVANTFGSTVDFLGKGISNHRHEATAALAASALLGGPAVGDAAAPVTPVTPVKPKIHYMSVDGKALAKITNSFHKQKCDGKENILGISPTVPPARKKIGYLSASFKTGQPPKAHLVPSKSTIICGAVAYTVDRQHAFVPTFDKKGWFKDVNIKGSGLAMQYLDVYGKKK